MPVTLRQGPSASRAEWSQAWPHSNIGGVFQELAGSVARRDGPLEVVPAVLGRGQARLGTEGPIERAGRSIAKIEGQVENRQCLLRGIRQHLAGLLDSEVVQEGVEVPVAELLVDDPAQTVLRYLQRLSQPADGQTLLAV